jgi:transglutaminase-like putative cysteine protease
MSEHNFLKPTSFVDSEAKVVVRFAGKAVEAVHGEKARAVALYNAVRDSIAYDPYLDYSNPAVYRASDVLKAGRGFCVGKAALLAACARAIGIPARMGYADVRNHMTSKRLHDLTQTNIFFWHSYTELFINGKWLKCTPAFDSALCARAKLAPLEFDGEGDSLFQPFDPAGRKHMEYLNDRGAFDDVPFELIRSTFLEHYPRLMEAGTITGNFNEEVNS